MNILLSYFQLIKAPAIDSNVWRVKCVYHQKQQQKKNISALTLTTISAENGNQTNLQAFNHWTKWSISQNMCFLSFAFACDNMKWYLTFNNLFSSKMVLLSWIYLSIYLSLYDSILYVEKLISSNNLMRFPNFSTDLKSNAFGTKIKNMWTHHRLMWVPA